jgi:hypothetical protein
MSGIVVMKWDEKYGTEIVTKHPKEFDISDPTLMQLFCMHEFSGGEGFVQLCISEICYSSYYLGPEMLTYIVAISDETQSPEFYEEYLEKVAKNLIPLLENESDLNNPITEAYKMIF